MSLVLIPDGPGVHVEVVDGLQGLPVAPRGSGAILGQFQSGPTAKAALALSPSYARLVSGGEHDDFEGSLALSDVYSEASPPMLLGRVTDGTDIRARSFLWDRNPPLSFSKTNGELIPDRAPLATVFAQNGGRWAGAKRYVVGVLNAVASDIISDNTVDISTAPEVDTLQVLPDMFKGGTITFKNDQGGPYVIASNTTSQVTIQGKFSQQLLDATGSGTINGAFQIELESERELTVVVPQDSSTGQTFALKALRKFKSGSQWEPVSSYDNLNLGPDENKPWIKTITQGEELDLYARYQFVVESDYDAAGTPEMLPSNFSEAITQVVDYTITYQWWRFACPSTNTGNGYVSALSALFTSSVVPHIMRITFTSSSAFDVEVEWPDGSTQDLGSGTVGSQFSTDHPQLSRFTIVAGPTGWANNDTMTIRVNPLPADLSDRDAYLYPFLTGVNSGRRFRIVSNTYNTISVRDDIDLTAFFSVGTAATILTADLSSTTFTSGNTIILTPDSGAAITFTSGSSVTGAAAIVAALTALDTAQKFTFEVEGNAMRITVRGSYGGQSRLVVGAGTQTLPGATSGTSAVGGDGSGFRIEARMPMWGGYDGMAPSASNYALAMDLDDSVFQCYMNVNLGGVRLAAPGLTSTVEGPSAGMDAILQFCERNGWIHVADTPTSLESQSSPGEAAVAHILNQAESDFRQWRFPSRAKYLNVAATRLVERSSAGHLIGIYARLANIGIDSEKGLHLAAANKIQGRLSPRAKGLPDSIGRWSPPVGLMNDHGIVPVLWEGPEVYMYGNRMYSQGRTPAGSRYTITERAVYYHIARDMFITARPLIFKSISVRRLGEIQTLLREKLRPYQRDGWFSDQGGTAVGFEQQVTVELPASLNTPAALLEGNVYAKIGFTPRPALERLYITLSPLQTEAT